MNWKICTLRLSYHDVYILWFVNISYKIIKKEENKFNKLKECKLDKIKRNTLPSLDSIKESNEDHQEVKNFVDLKSKESH